MSDMPNGFSCLSPKNNLGAHVWASADQTHNLLWNRIIAAFRDDKPNSIVPYVCLRCGYATSYRYRRGPKRTAAQNAGPHG